MRSSTWVLSLWLAVVSCTGSSRDSGRTDDSAGSKAVSGSVRADMGEGSDDGRSFDPRDLVKLELVASVDRIGPGEAFDIGAHFTMKPGWHIYWENPGESGLKTRAAFHAPAQVELDGARFPGPIVFKSPGDVVSYGYEHSTVVFARGQAAPDLSGSELTFRVDARWLACQQACVPGKASAEVTVPVGAGGAAANEAVLAPHRVRLPRPLSELGGASAEWTSAGGLRVLVVRVPGARSVAFFPAADQPARIAGHDAGVSDGQGVVAVRYRGKPKMSTPAGGVVRVDSDSGSAYYQVSVPWS